MSWRDWFTPQAKRVELTPAHTTVVPSPLGAPSNFDRAFARLLTEEGGFTNDPKDKGNWTGGAVGVGELKGTKYGISAASYPQLDIANITVADAKAIYRRDYWDALELDARPRSEALCLFDSAVQHNVSRTKQFAAAVARGGDFVAQFQAERALFYARLETWPIYGRGWMRRLIRTAIEASK